MDNVIHIKSISQNVSNFTKTSENVLYVVYCIFYGFIM